MANSSSRILLANYLQGQNPFLKNYVKNDSCLVNVVNIAATDTTVSRNNTTPLTAVSDCQATLNSTNDDLQWSTNALDRSLIGQNCEAKLSYKLTLGSGNTIAMKINNISTTVAEVNLPSAANGLASINFPCGDGSESYFVQIAQTAGSSSQDINVANVYLGAATNVGTVAQAQLLGSVNFATATNCEWSNNTSTFTTPAADADCNLGVATGTGVSSPATKQPGITINNLIPGEYVFTATGAFYKTSSSNDRCFFRFSDGTRSTSSNQLSTIDAAIIVPTISGKLTVTSAAGAATFYIQAANDGASPVCEIDARNAPLEISVTRFPSSSEIAVSSNAVPNTELTYDGVVGMGSTNTSVIRFRTARKTYGSDVTFTDSTTLGSYFTVNSTGVYDISTSVGFATVVNAGIVINGTNLAGNVRTTTYAQGLRRLSGSAGSTTSASAAWSGNLNQGDIIYIQTDGSSPLDDAQTMVTITKINQTLTAPLLVGSVTSNSTGAERIERARINCDSGAAITSQSGSWIASIGNVSSGTCTLTLTSGMFSSAPSCTATIVQSATSTHAVKISSTATGSIVSLGIDSNSGATLSSYDFDVICMGPR